MTLFWPGAGDGEMEEAGEVDGAVVVAGGGTAEMLEATEASLDPVLFDPGI